jgi:hypothetical protein
MAYIPEWNRVVMDRDMWDGRMEFKKFPTRSHAPPSVTVQPILLGLEGWEEGTAQIQDVALALRARRCEAQGA